MLEVGAEEAAYGVPVRRARLGRSPSAHCGRSCAAGRDAGRDGVVDALPGHRVHQPGGVTGQQERAVGLVPAPAAERQVVTAPVLPGGGDPGDQPLELVEQELPAGGASLRSPGSSSPYPTLVRPSPRSKAQAYDGCRRSPYRITWRPASSFVTGA